MIYNQEQDNQIEGTYLRVLKISDSNHWVIVNLPDHFYIKDGNTNQWVVGYGMGKPYYDAGVENIKEIQRISADTLFLGTQVRGNKELKVGQKICFWNKSASGFHKKYLDELIPTQMFKGYHGNSIGFSSIVYDSVNSIWVTLLNEVDNDTICTYGAKSTDLLTWSPANDSLALLTPDDFKGIWWAGSSRDGKSPQTPVIYDVLFKNDTWFLFCDGYDSLGQRHIGLITTKNILEGPYEIQPEPIIKSGFSEWSKSGVFYAKVEEYKSGYLMFFVGEAANKTEVIGRAFSLDLFHWDVTNKPVISDHIGWRSFLTTASPNFIKIQDSTVYLLTSGTKAFMYGKKNNRVLSEYGLGVSGNVGDAQLGVFKSEDGGYTFEAFENNPVFTNNYADTAENQHMGGNFEYLQFEGKAYIIYQAKTTSKGHRYAIYIREK